MKHLMHMVVGGVLCATAVLIVAVGLARHDRDLAAPANLLLLFVIVGVYLLPAILAAYRERASTLWITLLDVFLGWTIFGWFIALGWAASGKRRPRAAVGGPPHGLPAAGH